MNIFRNSLGWRKGVIYEVQMLPRNAMFKPVQPVAWMHCFSCFCRAFRHRRKSLTFHTWAEQ